MAKRKCKKHPKYQGLRKPRARNEEGELCPACVEIFDEARKSNLKETRAPRRKKTKVNAEVKVAPVEQPKTEVTVTEITPEKAVEVVEGQVDDICCPDDEALNALLEDNDWDFDDDEEIDLNE